MNSIIIKKESSLYNNSFLSGGGVSGERKALDEINPQPFSRAPLACGWETNANQAKKRAARASRLRIPLTDKWWLLKF